MPVAPEYDAPGSTPGGGAGTPGRPHLPSPPRAQVQTPASDAVSEVIRWAAFSCAVVPVVLLLCGSPFGAALGAAAGLAAVTAASRALLRHSERIAARLDADGVSPHRGRHGRTGIGAHRGGRRV
ncbi:MULTISPECIES: hypothetical protein [Streptomyces]|uniref:hypothetical protein n=1 Tax=Streptomyces TaxID=1883 RepID=UPI002892CC17|nr:hypothetical protein [Streptomyces rhizosphaericus]